MVKKNLIYGRHKIEYLLAFEERKNLSISVLPSKEVLVKAPLKSDIYEVENRIQNKGSWILKKIRYFDQFHPLQPEREYVSGETHYYLGRQYRLRVRKGGEESVRLSGKFFLTIIKNPADRSQVKFLMRQWYADHAKIYLDERVKRYFGKIPGLEIHNLKISYKFLNKQWGLKNDDDSITLNIDLVKAPVQCIDYVIVHELCHLKHPKHNDDFYRLLRKVLPDWKERKDRLEFFGSFY